MRCGGQKAGGYDIVSSVFWGDKIEVCVIIKVRKKGWIIRRDWNDGDSKNVANINDLKRVILVRKPGDFVKGERMQKKRTEKRKEKRKEKSKLVRES